MEERRLLSLVEKDPAAITGFLRKGKIFGAKRKD